MCFRKSAKVQICWSESSSFHAGMPVQRMPCFIFQNVSPSGSSSTPSVESPLLSGADWRPGRTSSRLAERAGQRPRKARFLGGA